MLAGSWGEFFPLGSILGLCWPILAYLGSMFAYVGLSWLQLASNLAPTWPNLAQLGSNLAQLGPNLAQLGSNLAQLGPTWPQHSLNMAQLSSNIELKNLQNHFKNVYFAGF